MARSIVTNPDICNGRPIFEGTRITVESVLGFLSAGDAPEDIVRSFPELTQDDVRAALAFARSSMDRRFTIKDIA